jgi:hypothetical protein
MTLLPYSFIGMSVPLSLYRLKRGGCVKLN